MNSTISEQHLNRTAYVYVRQSTLAQVRHHQESTERQYALTEKALELGWRESSVQILDRDLWEVRGTDSGTGRFQDAGGGSLDGPGGRRFCAGGFATGALESGLASLAGTVRADRVRW